MIDMKIFISVAYCGFLSIITGHQAVAAAVPWSSSSPSWRGSHEGYRQNEDIPIMNSDTKRRRGRRRKYDDDGNSAVDREPQGEADSNDDQWMRYQHDKRRHRRRRKGPLESFRLWTFDKTSIHIPHINLKFDPITILKIRKSWDFLPGARVMLGADFETHRLEGGLWRIRGCVEDKIIGGRFTIRKQQQGGYDNNDSRSVLLEYSKSWLFAESGSIGKRFNVCAEYDITTRKGSARLGFRTESIGAVGTYQLMPGGRKGGIVIVPIVPLDNERRWLLEAKTKIELPEPEFVIGTDFDTPSFDFGIGGDDIDVEVKEVNLILNC